MDATRSAPAPFTRMFGWIMIGVMTAFILNAILMFWFGFPGASTAFSGGGFLGVVQLLIYVVAAIIAAGFVMKSPDVTLRTDAARVNDLNTFLVRACFWVVLLVGLADAVISFLRVSETLAQFVGEDLAGDLGRAQFRGLYVHTPLVILGIVIAFFTRSLGFIWLALLVVVAELLIVIGRFVFSYEQAFLADLVRFWYGALFLFASAYTLFEDGHVRVDLFYASMRRENQGRVNAIGSVIMGMLLCWTILIIGFQGSSSAIVGPILVFEVTQSGFGMYVKYFMAGFLGIFAVTMMVQFVAQLFDSVADARGEPGHRESHSEMM